MMEPECLSEEESDVDEDGKCIFKVRRLRWQRDTFRELKDYIEEVHRDQLTPPAPRPVEEEGGNGKVFLKGCARGLSKVCEEKERREIEKERKREKESDNVCI